MNKAIPAILILLSILIIGCASSTVVLECASPLIQKGDGCCLDADKNGVCDTDERIVVEKKSSTNKTVVLNDTSKANATQQTTESTQEAAKGTLSEAEKTAKLFVDNWQNKQYNVMYAMFTPALKAKKTAAEFAAIIELDAFYKKVNKIELKGVSLLDDDTAAMSIMTYTNLQEVEVPSATLEFIQGTWRANVFSDVFDLTTYEAACTGYKYNNKYQMSDCAYDLAKKVKDVKLCNISECHYVECLKALGQSAGIIAEAQQCGFCQPVGKTVNTCIVDVAVKYNNLAACSVIPEDNYSDKYCTCYGGYAKAKKDIALCNVIQNPDNKELCEKAYKGEYC